MPFKALLLSKDAEVVQSLRRVLSDLDIGTEHCVEPFSAAKKLLDQHFDAIIVDCEDAQGAGWVVQSARMAALNKTSIIIAIQSAAAAGGSKLGENFTLQRPLVGKQAEATLKTARGMMKPGTGSAAPSTAASILSPPIAAPEVPRVPVGPSGAVALDLDDLINPKAPPSFAETASIFKPTATEAASRDRASASSAFSTGAAAAPARERSPMSLLEPETREALADAALEKLSTLATPPPAPARSLPPEQPGILAAGSSASSTKAKVADLIVPVGGSLAPSPGQHPSSIFDSARRHASELQERSNFAEADVIRQRFSGSSYCGRKNSHFGIIALVVALLALVASFAWTRFHRPPSTEGEGLHAQPLTPVVQPQPTVVPPRSQSLVDQPDPNVAEPLNRVSQSAPADDSNPVKPSAGIVAREKPENPSSDIPAATATPVSIPPQAPPHVAEKPIEKPAPASTTPAEVEPTPLPTNLAPASGSAGPAINNLLSSVAVPAPPAAVPPQRIQISQGIVEGMLVHTVKPIYPAMARNAHIEGQVILKAIIAKDGSIRDLKVLKGPAMLTRAAITAVKEWRYKPYLLNAQPVEVETQITLDFRL